MLRGYKYRIYPDGAQRELIEKHFGACRLVYNLGLEIKIASYKTIEKSPSAFDLCYQLVELKKEFTWLNELDSQALQASVKKLDKSFQRFFKGAGFPKFKNKAGGQSYQIPNNTRRIDWERSTLTVSKIKNIPIVLSRKFEGKIKTVTISKNPTGKYFASILVDNPELMPKEKQPVRDSTSIGIDLGVKSFIVLSTGEKIENPKWLRNKQQRLKVLQKRVSRKKKGGKNRKKAQYKVAILHEKVSNQRSDFQHKISFRLVRDNQTICMEDLHLKGMTRRCKPKKNEQGTYIENGQAAKSGLNKSIMDAGLGNFTTMIEYKSEWYGTNLLKLERFDPSSKLCSVCGEKNSNLQLSDREWICANCGTKHDRDENAAINAKQILLRRYCQNNNSGKPLPVEPLESSALAGATKEEILKGIGANYRRR